MAVDAVDAPTPGAMTRDEMRRIQRLPSRPGKWAPIGKADSARQFNRDNLVKIAAEKVRETRNPGHPSLAPLTKAEKLRALRLALQPRPEAPQARSILAR